MYQYDAFILQDFMPLKANLFYLDQQCDCEVVSVSALKATQAGCDGTVAGGDAR